MLLPQVKKDIAWNIIHKFHELDKKAKNNNVDPAYFLNDEIKRLMQENEYLFKFVWEASEKFGEDIRLNIIQIISVFYLLLESQAEADRLNEMYSMEKS